MDLLTKFRTVVDTIRDSVKVEGRPIIDEEIAEKIPISREYFSRLYSGKHPIRQKHIDDLLLRFPNVHVILDELNEPTTEKYHIKRRTQKQSQKGPTMVPFVPIKAQAGYVRALDQEMYLDTLEKFALPPGVSGHGAIWRYWEIEGDSMEPVFKSGDIILTSLVHPMDWENLRNFYTYVIVTADRVLIKRIYCKNPLEWVLISENEENYPQQILPVEYIKEVWVYRRTWSTRAEPTKRFEIKV
jgi:phage repressor protein C with HTH and peptisase S24 domain